MVTIPRAEIDAVTDRHHDDGFFGNHDMTVHEIRACTTHLRTAATACFPDNAEEIRAMADDLDALADRYEREAC